MEQKSLEKALRETRETIREAVAAEKVISVVTYYLSDYGENVLNLVAREILEKYGRMDLHDIVYTSAKELVINGTKANLKRAIFTQEGLDLDNPEEYSRGMEMFRENLSEENIKGFRRTFREMNFPVTATFYYKAEVLNIKVKNNFTLITQEQERIRTKFAQAQSFTSLLDFFMEHGDATEGAGLGLTMVGILLDETGIDRHAFTLYSNEKYNETAARLEIPLKQDYIPRRLQFERELETSGLSRDEFRLTFKPKF